jgi:hypothetical protein
VTPSYSIEEADKFNIEMLNKRMTEKLSIIDEYYGRFSNSPVFVSYLMERVEISSRLYLADAYIMLCKEISTQNNINRVRLKTEKKRLEVEEQRLYYEKKRLVLEMKQAKMFEKKE